MSNRKNKNRYKTENKGPEKNEIETVPEVQNEKEMMIHNGLTKALIGFEPGSTGTQLSQVDTIYKNNRWYLISNMRQVLSELYIEHGVVQAVIDVPVDDAMRGGIHIKTEQLEEQEIHELQKKMEREGDLQVMAQALKWNRLYGGAGIIIVTNQNPSHEFKPENLYNAPLSFRAADMWELFYRQMNLQDTQVDEKLQFKEHEETFNYYGKTVHNSRVMKMRGKEPPSFLRPRLRGWGFSVVESIIRSVNQYLKSNNLSFEVMDEFKVDVFKLKDLVSTLLNPGGEEKVQKRVHLANQQKNFQNAMVIDGEDEYEQKQVSFQGLSNVMQDIRKQLASDLRMPMTKLFGISSAGFNAGEDDIENYNAMIEGSIREVAKHEIIRMSQLRAQQLFGFIPDDMSAEYEPLRVMSSEQQETVKDSKFTRLLQARQSGEISNEEFRQGVNKEDLLPVTLEEDEFYDENKQAMSVENSKKTISNAKRPEKFVSSVAIVTEDGYILNGHRKDTGRWTFPGGHLEQNESPHKAAMRECKEECGINLQEHNLKLMGTNITQNSHGETIKVFSYRAVLESKIMPKTTEDPDGEVSTWEWQTLDKLKTTSRHSNPDYTLDYITKGE